MFRKPGKEYELTTTLQVEMYRQTMKTENRANSKQDVSLLKQYERLIEEKNSYLDKFKREDVKKEEVDKEAKKSGFAYDIVKEKEFEGKGDDDYNQKSHKESNTFKRLQKRKEPKQELAAPITSTHEYGWRQPIDTFNFGYQKSGICKRTFHDGGHLS